MAGCITSTVRCTRTTIASARCYSSILLGIGNLDASMILIRLIQLNTAFTTYYICERIFIEYITILIGFLNCISNSIFYIFWEWNRNSNFIILLQFNGAYRLTRIIKYSCIELVVYSLFHTVHYNVLCNLDLSIYKEAFRKSWKNVIYISYNICSNRIVIHYNTVVFLVCCIRNIVMEAVFFINLHLIIQLDRLVILIKLEYIIGTSKNITVRSFAWLCILDMDRSDVIITIWDRTILIKEKTNLVSCIVSSYFIQFKRIRINTIKSLLNCNTCSVALLCLWISLYIVDPAFLCACKRNC